MATLAPPSPSTSPTRMPRKWARKCERYCCLGATYFPLVFVYGITSWAVWVEAYIGLLPVQSSWTGTGTSILGIALYILLNWSYTTAVFTSPGTTIANNGYSSLPTQAPPAATNFTVKSNGELRFCKKCQARKPDRSHHCRTCQACVLKMDHHCPWLATCVGLRNYKAFLLFLSYTTIFCFLCFAVSASWAWREILSEGEYQDDLMPINYVMLCVISGIIGIVLFGFTGWHIWLAGKGQTTIECLEKTRYLSPARKAMKHHTLAHSQGYGQSVDMEAQSEAGGIRHESYDAMERHRARERYESYLDEQDSEKLPSAFDLGWKRNLSDLFGPKPALWFVPICNTVGDGWSWEPSPKWLQARERIASDRQAQTAREAAAGWGGDQGYQADYQPNIPAPRPGAGRHYSNRGGSKADRILGRTPDDYADGGMSMENLRPRKPEDQYEISSDEDEAERRKLDRKAAGGWPNKVGVVTNTLLGNTIARQKDDVRGWDGIDEGVD